jgi:hypothetical protein
MTHGGREATVSDGIAGGQVVGIDLHLHRSVIARIDAQGAELGWVRIDNDPKVLVREVCKAGGRGCPVAIEATYGWYWAVDALLAAGFEVHLAHPLGMKALRKRRELTNLNALTAAQPTDGLVSNNITIYPPSRVYGGKKFNQLDAGDIVLEQLTFGTRDSDTVRRLQHRLNGIRLQGGADLRPTGNYNAATRHEVIKWQIQKRNATPGTPEANGNVNPAQAAILFRGPRFQLVP